MLGFELKMAELNPLSQEEVNAACKEAAPETKVYGIQHLYVQ